MQKLTYRKDRQNQARPMGNGGGSRNNPGVSQENLNFRGSSKHLNRGTVLPAASDVPDYFTIDITISSGTNIDVILFDANGFVLAAQGLTQGANATITSGPSAAFYTALCKNLAVQNVQIVGVDYYSSTSDQKTLYQLSADFNAGYTKTPIYVLSGKSPMQTTQTYLKLDTNFIIDERFGFMVRIASSSETVRLGFHVAGAFDRNA